MTIDAVILAGGKGTRLASVVQNVAKPMAEVDGRPFVDVIVKRLQDQGISRIIMATGHKAESVYEYYKDKPGIVCIREGEPMGTGGAVLHAIREVPDLSDDFFVLNGDSFYPFDLAAFRGAPLAFARIGAVEMADSGRYGTLQVNHADMITKFLEKTGENRPGIVNAGVYHLQKFYLEEFEYGPCSIEQDIFPIWADLGELIAVPNKGPMLDIGLPETYGVASEFLRQFT